MSVSLYFGLPGAGKTTMMANHALKGVKDKRYKHVFCNVRLAVDGVTYIDNECVGKYDLSDCLLLIDEATLFADSRDYKSFSKGKMAYFLEYRHFNADIILYTQQWNGVDLKIRTITNSVYYVYKGFLTGRWFSKCCKIPYGLAFPDPKTGEKYGDIQMGYGKPSLFLRIFSTYVYRPKYYKYFDSWEKPYLPPLPAQYRPYKSREVKTNGIKEKALSLISRARDAFKRLRERVRKLCGT